MLPCQFPFDKAAQNAHVQREYQRCKTSHGTLLCQWADEPVARKTSSIMNLEKLYKVLFDCPFFTKKNHEKKKQKKQEE